LGVQKNRKTRLMFGIKRGFLKSNLNNFFVIKNAKNKAKIIFFLIFKIFSKRASIFLIFEKFIGLLDQKDKFIFSKHSQNLTL